MLLIWRGPTYFAQNNTNFVPPGDTRRTTSELPDAGDPFLAPNRKLGEQNFKFFLQYDTVFEIINSFSWILNAIASKKLWPTAMPFLLTDIDVGTIKLFPTSESRLVNSNFRRTNRMQRRAKNGCNHRIFNLSQYLPFAKAWKRREVQIHTRTI